jgi:sialate O-acetylesterase
VGGVARATVDVSQAAHTGMAVTIDIGEENDVHPKNKREVGHRLALAVLAKVYGKDVDYSGPIFRTMRVEKGLARIWFDHVNMGLVIPNCARLKRFTLAADDPKYELARARIEGDEIIVWNDDLSEPV